MFSREEDCDLGWTGKICETVLPTEEASIQRLQRRVEKSAHANENVRVMPLNADVAQGGGSPTISEARD